MFRLRCNEHRHTLFVALTMSTSSFSNSKNLISQLPSELLFQIYPYLSSASLYNLSKLSRHLHHTALDFLFRHHGIGDPYDGWITLYRVPREILPALHSALFLNKLDNYHVYLPSEVDDVLFDLRAIKATIERMGIKNGGGGCKNLKFFLNDIDMWISAGGVDFDATLARNHRKLRQLGQRIHQFFPAQIPADRAEGDISNNTHVGRSELEDEDLLSSRRLMWTRKVNVEKWRDAFLDVLEEGLENGCSQIGISGGARVVDAYCDSAGNYWFGDIKELDRVAKDAEGPQTQHLSTWAQFKSASRLLSRVFDWSPVKSEPEDQGEATAPALDVHEPGQFESSSPLETRCLLRVRPIRVVSNNQLATLNLDGSLLLEPPLLTWTINLLNNSPSLTSLSLHLQTLLPSSYARIFPLIFIPSLRELSFMDVNVSWKDLGAFLSRHGRSIVKLSISVTDGLDSLPTGGKGFEFEVGWESPVDELSMPMLEEMAMTPIYVVWMLNWEPDALEVEQTPLYQRFPSLNGIVLITDRHTRTYGVGFCRLARALHRIGRFIKSFKVNATDNPSMECPLKTLTFRCYHPISFQRFLEANAVPIPLDEFIDSDDSDTASTTSITRPDNSIRADPIVQILSSLDGITTLRFGAQWFDFTHQFVVLLPRFAKRFPDVEVLEVIEHQEHVLKKMRRKIGRKMLARPEGIKFKGEVGEIIGTCWRIPMKLKRDRTPEDV
ncbi:hypothetical protein BDN72DRAFT_882499 [Pluteus cervinus]|uniref:Uncharacterized protein n=1 Tax=Pluteus cervinus TaxID=181527 RepID=A0ACD3ABF9_9AGAR|nr:hypothetical protein BDN72DRAFT_882499 [Pluteus cervinus]